MEEVVVATMALGLVIAVEVAMAMAGQDVETKVEIEKVSEYPAVIVEPVPSARLEQGYAAQVLVYDDETYMMQDVAEEQEVETENVETGIA
ncbi:ETS-related transcription factor Elf-2 [Tupaia chinensis]|uniref:ETS-related transcription factor Elf-2 n=1 Tax=Tupaia chinensis TaxID=246437 RepID=L9L286_TUPCH|nr:ETS-related transcription factor Elf-2 [Tupaia chinensis]